jgi:type II secretory pathway pseudopilin PulG
MREVQGGSAASTFHLSLSTSARQSRRAVTLIELIGVMAIIGFLSAVVLPPLISKIEDANTTKEDANLEEIARALVAGIKATGTIPNPTTPNFTPGSWTAIALNYTTLGQTALASVLPANNDRQIILSANLAAYVTANGNSYATDPDGWPNPLPNDLKIYILASSKNGLPLQAGIPVADIANWTKVFNAGTGTVAVPASVFGAANTTKGEFLHVKVVDLNQLFCRVELTDTACPPISTINGGAGYAIGEVITFNVGPYPFSFTAPGALFSGQSGNLAGNPPQMLGKPFSGSTTADPGNGYRVSGTSGGSGASATLSSTPPPRFEINSLGPQLFSSFSTGNVMPPFYLLKSTSLSLLDDTGSLLLTVAIQGDSNFKYFNKTWAKID